MGHGPVVFPGGRHPLRFPHTPRIPREPFRYGPGSVFHPHHGPVSPLRLHFGPGPVELHRPEPFRHV